MRRPSLRGLLKLALGSRLLEALLPPVQRDDGAAPRRSVGLLFVHGMGDQPEGDTLGYMGDPFLTWSRDWLTGHGGASEMIPCSCRPVPGDEAAPQHTHARWTINKDRNGNPLEQPQQVDIVVAEAWWAHLFDAPSASRISDWIPPLVWGVASRALIAIAAVVGMACAGILLFTEEDWTTVVPFALAAAVGLCVIVAVLPSALLLAGKLPGALGNASQSFLNFLILAVGDVLVYQQNPRDAFAARNRIVDRLKWLGQNAGVGEIVVGAHSLGSLLAIDALAEAREPKAMCLVSFGCPIRLLMKHQSHYGDRLAQLRTVQPDMGWVNFFDPLDLIGGPVDNQQSFPLNVNVDNGRSILGAHGGYPGNLEQFQTALFRLALFDPASKVDPVAAGRTPDATRGLSRLFGKPRRVDDLTSGGQRFDGLGAAPPTTDDDKSLLDAFRRRWWRFIMGTAFMGLSVPATMGGAYLLSQTSWAKFVADSAQTQKPLPGWLKDLLHDAVEGGIPKEQVVGSLLICIITAACASALVLWIGHLVLFNTQSDAQSALAAGAGPRWWRAGARFRFAALWTVWGGTIAWSAADMVFRPGSMRALYLFLPAAGMAFIVVWAMKKRLVRHPAFARAPRTESARAAAALGVPFFCIEHGHRKGRRPRGAAPEGGVPQGGVPQAADVPAAADARA